MSLSRTPADVQIGPGPLMVPGPSLVAAVAEAIASAAPHQHFGCYDYSRYPGDAAPHVVRDDWNRIVLFRSWDGAEATAFYERITREYVAECALAAVVKFYGGPDVTV